MATSTTNYGWTKPSYEDDADIMVINGTIDAIDAQVKTNKNNILTVADQSVKYNYCKDSNFTESVYKIVAIDTLTAGVEYVVCFGTLSSTDTDSDICQANFHYNGGSAVVQKAAERGSNITFNITPSSAINQMYIYASNDYAHSSGDSLTVANLRIVPKSLWDAGFTDYQPYAMTNAEITAWILAHS